MILPARIDILISESRFKSKIYDIGGSIFITERYSSALDGFIVMNVVAHKSLYCILFYYFKDNYFIIIDCIKIIIKGGRGGARA